MRQWRFHLRNKPQDAITWRYAMYTKSCATSTSHDLWKTTVSVLNFRKVFVISKCNGLIYLIFWTNFNWLFNFLAEEFVSFEMYFLQVWRRLGFTASNRILEPEWLPLFFPYFQTLIIFTQWYVRKSYPCLAWHVDIVFMVRCSVFAKTSW